MLIVKRCILVSHELLSCEFSQTGLKINEIRLNLVKKDYTTFRMHFGFPNPRFLKFNILEGRWYPVPVILLVTCTI